MSRELLETKSKRFLDDLCHAFVAAVSHELLSLPCQSFREADTDVSVLHSRGNLQGPSSFLEAAEKPPNCVLDNIRLASIPLA